MKIYPHKNTLNFIIYQVSSISLFSFILLNHVSISLYPSMGFIIPLILGIISIALVYFLPKNSMNIKINNFLKILIKIYLIFTSSIIISTSCFIICFYFYTNMSYLLCALLILLMTFLLSFFKSKHLYDLTVSLFLILIVVNLLPIFNTSDISIDLLYNIKLSNILPKNILLLLSMLFIFLDPIIFYFNDFTSNYINKRKAIILSIIISSFISSITIFINYLYYSNLYLSKTLFPAFSSLTSFLGPEFIDHFTILILINVVFFALMRVSFNITLLIDNKQSSYSIDKLLYSIFIFLFVNFIFIFSSKIYNFYLILYLLCFIFIFFLYGSILYQKRSKK